MASESAPFDLRFRASSGALNVGRRPHTHKPPAGPVCLPSARSSDAKVEVFSMSPRAEAEINVDNGWTLTGVGSDSSTPGTPETHSEADDVALGGAPEFSLAGTPPDVLQTEHVPSVAQPDRQLRGAGDLSLIASDFVHVEPTCMTLFRSFMLRRYGVARVCLWAWFTLLVLGELGTTLWWLHSLGLKGLLLLVASATLVVSIALSVLSPEQVLAIATSVLVAAIPALPAYSAVLLVVPSELDSSSGSDCWEALHLPTLFSLAAMYIASALLPALRAEYPSPGDRVRAALSALEAAQRLARGACVIALWVYLTVALHVAAVGLQASSQKSDPWRWRNTLPSLPVTTGRGFVLALHLLGLACAEARLRTVVALSDDLLPSLFGAQRAKSLTLRALAYQHGRGLLSKMPTLRRCVPPKIVVAFIISLRRTAPALLPGFALLTQMWRVGFPRVSALLAFAIVALICAIASCEWFRLPHSPLRRLPLLLPPKVAPCTRKALGYALALAEGLADAHAGISYIGIGRRRIPWRK